MISAGNRGDDRHFSVPTEWQSGVRLARAGSDVTEKVADNAHDVTQIVSQLAAQHFIRPTITQGHIGDVLKDKIAYDAATTLGGSGGPLSIVMAKSLV
jgi:hypothetical protein